MSCRRTVALKERSSSLCRYRKSSEAADIRTLLFLKSYKHGSSDTPSGPVAACRPITQLFILKLVAGKRRPVRAPASTHGLVCHTVNVSQSSGLTPLQLVSRSLEHRPIATLPATAHKSPPLPPATFGHTGWLSKGSLCSCCCRSGKM